MIIMALLLGSAHALTIQQNNAATKWMFWETKCRGSAGNDPKIDIYCEKRDRASTQMRTLGVCYGRPNQSSAAMRIRRCEE
jgi:hypothetical protein